MRDLRRYTVARALAALAALLFAPLPACAQAPPPEGQPSARPTLVVFLTIDQMRADYVSRFDRQLTGGLRRLLDGGAVFLNGYQDHAITETAPGHAAVMSGRFPVHTGIVMNVEGVNDAPDGAVLGGRPSESASPFRFRGTTLVDWIRATIPQMRFLSVSRKDRGAILPIGTSKGDVYWWASQGFFTTSRYYADSLPTWVQQFNARRTAQSYAGQSWTLLLPESAYPEPDSVPVESGGLDVVFPHAVPEDSALAARVAPRFPWMDDITLAFALAGLQQLELGALADRTDVLAISLSTMDAIGHQYGPDSRELHDQVLRLDRYLGVFFDSLFTLRDRRRIVIALTSDHGVAPFWNLRSPVDPNGNAKQVTLWAPWRSFLARLRAAGVDTTAVAVEESAVVVTKPDAFTNAGVKADSAIATFGRDAMRVEGVLRADLMTALARADTARDAIARRWLHMFAPNGPVRMVVTLTPYSTWPLSVPIAMHGSPHDYDAKVPIVLYGAGVRPGRYSGVARVVDMAPTLAALVGVPPLEKLDGRPLIRAIR